MQPTVVIIDDVELLELLVSEHKPQYIMSFPRPVEAIAKLTIEQFLLLPTHVILDHNMPLMDGFECLKALREDLRFMKTRIAVISEYE